MVIWLVVARSYGLDGPFAALVNLIACGVPMVAWALLVDKVHRNPTTGVNWGNPRPLRETLDISLTKIAGLWLTWGGIAGIYAICRFYWEGNFAFAMWCFQMAAPAVFILSVPYVLWIDRRLDKPKDGAWALGAWLLGLKEPIEREAIYNHLRSWGVKAFFLAFMLAIVPPGFGAFIRADSSGILTNPVALANWLITGMFMIDVAFATVGYILTFRPLDSHIRTANPYAGAWAAALICYPPFILMGSGGPLDYHPGTSDWTHWLAGYDVLLWIIGAVLVALTAIYAWATMAFGFRFSNLTHRGIITHGPYSWTRHPAYLSKNLFWWISTCPLLVTTGSLADAVRATALLGLVSAVYYWRAKTEEKHLGADPAYQEYSEWMERNAPIPRFFAWVTGRQRVIS
ncbi:MAG: protein-S-isoprenylcysteine methyltransferase [Alphaproteobacteria bacterium HGW-Alphaproteobacteria-16]|nr:MAG: protein-S-isoprenylcysteine methyltransferase [Alphaproteobacteria bacterium HGW-Alphaproteobacteria-16]